uniref:Odorant-binding protein 22 n=1 Tax=Matsumurasca onukii TaxID=2912585 RepID=A0A343WGY7_MATON|nr:odorant-binding protein 22 [Matsumurasca onukii]
MQWPVVTVLVSLSLSCALADDECRPKPGEKHVSVKDCCKLDLSPSSMQATAHKCFEKFPHPKPTGPPSGPPSAEMRNSHACMAECFFAEEKLLTADKQVDKDAVLKYFSSWNPEWTPLVKSAVDECFGSYMADVDPTLECKSGAEQLKKCLMRQLFLNCPSAAYTASAECDGFKAKVEKCPNMPLFMGPPGGPPK